MKKKPRPFPEISRVKEFWEKNPLCASAVDAEPGSEEFFNIYDKLRERNEPVEFAQRLHEYESFQGKKVLEVGCGNAYTLAKYAEHGAVVYGIDITEKAVALSKKRFMLKDLKGDFRNGNAEKLPYESEFFDCICSMGVLHHVPDTSKAVDEIYRCLKPDGRLIIMMYNRHSFAYQVIFRFMSIIKSKTMQQLVNEIDGIGNPKGDVYTKKELKLLLKKFRNIEMFCGLVSIPRTRVYLPSSFSNIISKTFGWFLYAKAEK